MNFDQAVKAYQANPVKEELEKQVSALCREMTLNERIYMLSGHTIGQTQVDMIRTGRNYNVRSLKRLQAPRRAAGGLYRRAARRRHGQFHLLPGVHAAGIML